MNNVNKQTQCDHIRWFSWHNKNFEILDILAVLLLLNFVFTLISTRELETLFSAAKKYILD